MKAAAGPHDLGGREADGEGPLLEARHNSGSGSETASSPSNSDSGDDGSSFTSVDTESDIVVHNTTTEERDDFDAIAAYVFQNSDAEYVVLHHRDIALLRGPGGDVDLPTQLLESCPQIAVDENGVGVIRHKMDLPPEMQSNEFSTPWGDADQNEFTDKHNGHVAKPDPMNAMDYLSLSTPDYHQSPALSPCRFSPTPPEILVSTSCHVPAEPSPITSSRPLTSGSSLADVAGRDICRQSEALFDRLAQRWYCGGCNRTFRDRHAVRRHIATVGTKVTCRYCGTRISARADSLRRHLRGEYCRKQALRGGFTTRDEENAFIEDHNSQDFQPSGDHAGSPSPLIGSSYNSSSHQHHDGTLQSASHSQSLADIRGIGGGHSESRSQTEDPSDPPFVTEGQGNPSASIATSDSWTYPHTYRILDIGHPPLPEIWETNSEDPGVSPVNWAGGILGIDDTRR